MIATAIQVFLIFILPFLIQNGLKDRSISRILSPVVVCFIIGICAGTFLPDQINKGHSSLIQNVSITIAIPLLLMSSNFAKWLPKAKGVLFAFGVSCISVSTAVVVAFLIFREQTEHAWLISSMFLAGFTGTIANASAVGEAINAPEEIMSLVIFADMITGAAYLIFLTSIAHTTLGKILPPYRQYLDEDKDEKSEPVTRTEIPDEDFSYVSQYRMKQFGIYIAPLLISILILAMTMGMEMLLFPTGDDNEIFILLMVTFLGIVSSFFDRIRNLLSSYRIGLYLLLVFCIALGTKINAQEAISSSSLVLSYAVVVMLIVIVMNVALARFFKIDVDTFMITTTSTIYGPAFIGQVASAMKNKEIIFSGMIASMVGIALGNFLGVGLAKLLQLIG